MAVILTEDFEGTGIPADWTEVAGNTGSQFNYDVTPPGTPPVNLGSQCLQLSRTTAGAQIYKTFGNTNIVWFRGYFYIDSANSSNPTTAAVLYRITDSSAGSVMLISYVYNAAHQLNLNYRRTTTTIDHGNIATLALDTWHCLEGYYNLNTNVCQVYLNDTLVADITTADGTRVPNRMQIGPDAAGQTLRMFADAIVVDNANRIGPLSEETPQDVAGSGNIGLVSATVDGDGSLGESGIQGSGTVSLAAIVIDGSGAASIPAFTGSGGITLSLVTINSDVITKLVFMHRSSGRQMLASSGYEPNWGGFGELLGSGGYDVSDTDYAYTYNGTLPTGMTTPSSVMWDAPYNTDAGFWTDIGQLWSVLADTTIQGNGLTRRDNVMNALYASNDTYSLFPRPHKPQPGENKIVIFKSCYPNSIIYDDNSTTVAQHRGRESDYTTGGIPTHTLSNCKGIYNEILEYCKLHIDKMFIFCLFPPRWNSAAPAGASYANARLFCNWARTEWLQDAGWSNKNVFVFDYFNVLTHVDNHHRAVDGVEVWVKSESSGDVTAVSYRSGDNHPNTTGNQKVAGELYGLIDLWYDQYLDSGMDGITGSGSVNTAPVALGGSGSRSVPLFRCSGIITLSPINIAGNANTGTPSVEGLSNVALAAIIISGSGGSSRPMYAGIGSINVLAVGLSCNGNVVAPSNCGSVVLPTVQISGAGNVTVGGGSKKSIDRQIKENLIAAIAAIVINEDPEPDEFVYNTNVAKVESARKIDLIPCKNYVIVIPNEPMNELDNTIRADELNYLVWFLDGEEETDELPFTDRLQEVQPDFLRAIRLDPSRGDLAQNTTMDGWDFGIYTDANGVSHEGVWMSIKIDRMLNPDNPYEIAT